MIRIAFLALLIILAGCSIQEADCGGKVCGKIQVQCITTPCDPVRETFTDRCEAEERGAFDIMEGVCTGDTCSTHEECSTPIEYLIQSNCPFGAACIDQRCKVVCPLSYHDLEESISRPIMCEQDEDCDCSERYNRTIECKCLDNKCLSVELG